MDIFRDWREQGIQSTNQRLMAENARLRAALRMQSIVYWTSLGGVVVVALWILWRE